MSCVTVVRERVREGEALWFSDDSLSLIITAVSGDKNHGGRGLSS